MDVVRRPMVISKAPAVASAPANLEESAFLSVRELAEYMRTKKVSSVALTEMYLGRLKRYDPVLHFVVTLTEERAMTKAARPIGRSRREVSRTTAWNSVGCKGPSGCEGLSDDLGRGRV